MMVSSLAVTRTVALSGRSFTDFGAYSKYGSTHSRVWLHVTILP